MSKTLFLPHGFHLQAEDWKHVVWGDPKQGVYGRIPRALQAINGREDVLLRIGSGGSSAHGKKEAEVAFEYMLSHLDEIMHLPHPSSMSMQDYLQSIVCLEKETTTTTEELISAMNLCVREGVNNITLVSSPTHASRCLRDAEIIRTRPEFSGIRFTSVPSDTSYTGSGPSDVVIIEPPHRGDMHAVPIHTLAQRLIPFIKADEATATQFYEDLDAFLTEQEKKL